MKVLLELFIVDFTRDKDGYATNDKSELLEFGDVKKEFRRHLDDNYDHKLLLNKDDPWSRRLVRPEKEAGQGFRQGHLPGLVKVEGDPSTENLAGWIAAWAAEAFSCDVTVTIQETETNSVRRSASAFPYISVEKVEPDEAQA